MAVVVGVFLYVRGHKASVPGSTTSSTSTNSSSQSSGASAKTTADLTKLPLGDGKVTTTPKVGYLDSCTTNFKGGGAEHAGGWISGSAWNEETKPAVEGNVT